SPRRRRKRRRRRCSNSLPSPFQRFENGLTAVKKRSERQSSGLVDRGLNDFCRNFRTVLAAIAEPFLPQSEGFLTPASGDVRRRWQAGHGRRGVEWGAYWCKGGCARFLLALESRQCFWGSPLNRQGRKPGRQTPACM